MSHPHAQLRWALLRLAQCQGSKLDSLRLDAAMQAAAAAATPSSALASSCNRLGLPAAQWMRRPDPALLPLLAWTDDHGWVLLTERTATGAWRAVAEDGPLQMDEAQLVQGASLVDTRPAKVPFGFSVLLQGGGDDRGFIAQVYQTLRLFRGDLFEASLASAFIAMVALATSMFSMQVYDRVIPTRGEATLIILSSGVLLTILIELALKHARIQLMQHVTVGMDNRLSRELFARLLALRLDQVPASVGSLAGQMRGYEQVRGFYTASTLFTLIDLPMAIVLLGVMALVGHAYLALVPMACGVVAVGMALVMRRRILALALTGAQQSNLKTGLLVEAVEGMETIKAGSGGWKFLSRWIGVNQLTIHNDLQMRSANEGVMHLAAAAQQISYAGVVVVGAWLVMQGQMTTGALIACSIISGRVLAPVIMLPGLLVQHAQMRAALEGLEAIFRLKTDQQDVEQALTPGRLAGHFQLADVAFAYGDNPPSLRVPRLEIQPGERVAVLGPIGAGKSTLLRLLSGMYQPGAGQVLVDGLDLSHIHRQVVSEHVGYLQQDHRLFLGTLRENLLVGLPDPGDETLLQAMRRTGMDRIVSAHPKGLDRMISEGGKGLSGGQRQLVAFTRLVLANSTILLLDEPTANMDDDQERTCLRVLAEEAAKGKTMVIVTHKPSVLALVGRVIVVVGNSMVMDGPRDAVIAQLQQRAAGAVRPGTGSPPAKPVLQTPAMQ